MASVIGQAVRRSRRQLGFSTKTLAEHTGVAAKDIGDIEVGRGALAASALMRIARAMGLPSSVFLTDESARKATPPLDRVKFFHAADAPVLSEADVAFLMREVTRSHVFADLANPRVRLDDHYEPTKPGATPWRQGYELAASLRTKLGLGPAPVASIRTVVEDLLGILLVRHAFADSRLRAVAVRAHRGRLIVVSKSLPIPLLRVSIAHELCHHICDLGPNESRGESEDVDAEPLAGIESGEERRARAFAVMFLAPSQLLRETFGQPLRQFRTEDAAHAAATSLAQTSGIGATAALWHLFHLQYLDAEEEDVQAWQRFLVGGPAHPGLEPNHGDQDGLLRAIDAALASEEIDPEQADRLRSL